MAHRAADSAATGGSAVGANPGYRRPGLALLIAALGAVVLVLLVVGFPGWWVWWTPPAAVTLAASYLVVWLPLVIAVLLATWLAGRRSIVGDTGLRFRTMDVALGIALGLVFRAIAELISPTAANSIGPTLDNGDPALKLLVLAVAGAATVLLGPLIEELYFRGLLLRSLLGVIGGATGATVSIVVSSVFFALLHIMATGAFDWLTLVLLATFGAALAGATLWTGRLGTALLAHIVYNAVGFGLAAF